MGAMHLCCYCESFNTVTRAISFLLLQERPWEEGSQSARTERIRGPSSSPFQWRTHSRPTAFSETLSLSGQCSIQVLCLTADNCFEISRNGKLLGLCVCAHTRIWESYLELRFTTKSDSAASRDVRKARKMGLGYLRLLGEKKWA